MGPSATSWMLFFHVFAALWLAAGVFSGTVVRAQGRRATTLAERAVALRIGWRLANIYSLPGAILAGILGFGLIQARGWTFETRWIQVSIVLWVLMLANGVLYLRPILRRLLAAAEASAAAGAPTAELTRLAAAKGPRIAADLNALALVVLTWLMVMKPF
jgi:uncharacterized membrane protein